MPHSQIFDQDYELLDRYKRHEGRVYLTGTQALVRLPLMQRHLDDIAGLNTAGFISGYRGSPLAAYDRELLRAKHLLSEQNIVFQPGLNEDLAATAVWGSQQLEVFPRAKYDGVFGIWYGKGPGVDRSGDVLRHANAFGTSKYGGVLAIAGDDHAAQSSTISHQSDHVFMGVMMPILNPASVSEYLQFGLAGIAMSRFTGCWIGFKAITETVESSASVELRPDAYRFVVPEDGTYEMPPRHSLNFDPSLRWPEERHELERLVQRYRARAAWAFSRANKLDQIVLDSPSARIGIITTGKAYHDTMQALKDLGIDKRTASRIGLRICKVGMTWPLCPDTMRDFVRGLNEIIVIEEKREVMEPQIKWQLFNRPADRRPVIIGKEDEEGQIWLPCDDELSPRMIARLLASRLRLHHLEGDIDEALAAYEARKSAPPPAAAPDARIPYYCSGCPHNTSTRVPEGSTAIGGIGCHIMALSMNRDTVLFSHMGGEGANWVGIAPFTEKKHVFQNLGDGTYEHSGVLAIRQAVHAGVNITYKILYNDAVAMTGGQAIDTNITVPSIATQLLGEGVQQVFVVTDDSREDAEARYRLHGGLPGGVPLHHRDELESVQRKVRDIPGVTALIYDQTCAAEKRRRRKRGEMPDPPKRVIINDLVCEGCGDCSEQSNCISIEPLETEFGRKRQINQSSCNKDFSCVKGFCPSFVTVEGGELIKPDTSKLAEVAAAHASQLSDPTLPNVSDATFNILITGIGGTGVVTVGQIVGMAAHLEGKGVTGLDFTGLAQKNGAVVSHVKIGDTPSEMHAVRVGKGEAHLLLGCDMVVAGSLDVLARSARGRTQAIINTHVAPTAAFTLDTESPLPGRATQAAITGIVGSDATDFIDATDLATRLFGDSIAANMMMLGFAFQRGLVPVHGETIEQAIKLNGVAPDMNILAFQWGRLLAVHPNLADEVLVDDEPTPQVAQDLRTIVNRRLRFLKDYQNLKLAKRYRNFVTKVRRLEERAIPGSDLLATAVAKTYFKLLAYKDEYEVARLYTEGSFEKKLKKTFTGNYKLKFHMAPPIFGETDAITGRPKKRQMPRWLIWPTFRLLAKLKFLRGTPFDIFGFTAERRLERQLIRDYENTIKSILDHLTPDKHTLAIEIATNAAYIKGFGPVKEEKLADAIERQNKLMKLYLKIRLDQKPLRAVAAE